MRSELRVLASSASELSFEVFLLSLKVKKTSMVLVVEAIGLGLEGLQVALVLVEFATRTSVFGSNVFVNSFKLPSLVVQECFYTTFFGAHGVDTRLETIWGFGARDFHSVDVISPREVPECHAGHP